jgi:spore germination protein KB
MCGVKILDQIKISPRQIIMITITFIVSTSILLLPGAEAGKDAWLATMLGLIPGLITVTSLAILAKKFPQKTVGQYVETILGKYLGKLIMATILLYLISLTALSLRDLGQFTSAVILPATPLYVIIFTATMVGIYGARRGLEPIVRVNEIFLPILLLSVFFIMVLSYPNMDKNNLLPILDNGIVPVIKASIEPADWLGESILLAMVIPFISQKDKIIKISLLGVLLAGLLLTVVALLTIAVYSDVASNLSYPFLNVVRLITIGRTIERLELLIVPIWILAVYIKTSFLLYITAEASSQWLNFGHYKAHTIPLAAVIFMIANFAAVDVGQYRTIAVKIFPPVVVIFQTTLPVFLLLIALMRGSLTRKND